LFNTGGTGADSAFRADVFLASNGGLKTDAN
jgi:hypothetical protein